MKTALPSRTRTRVALTPTFLRRARPSPSPSRGSSVEATGASTTTRSPCRPSSSRARPLSPLLPLRYPSPDLQHPPAMALRRQRPLSEPSYTHSLSFRYSSLSRPSRLLRSCWRSDGASDMPCSEQRRSACSDSVRSVGWALLEALRARAGGVPSGVFTFSPSLRGDVANIAVFRLSSSQTATAVYSSPHLRWSVCEEPLASSYLGRADNPGRRGTSNSHI